MQSEVIGTSAYSLLTTLKDLNFKQELFYGSLAGVAIALVGHPFDTVKTCMQIYGTSLIGTIKAIVRNNGLLGFYKGVGSPLYTNALLNAVVFGVYESSRVLLSRHYDLKTDDYLVIAVSAALAGFANSFIVAPCELFKVQLHMETPSLKTSRYVDVFRRISGTG
jgi:solute carrier family 25 carnitine/acylcarnitine transporter 20/29